MWSDLRNPCKAELKQSLLKEQVKFDEEKGEILPSDKNPVAAKYTIDVLNLNAPYLCNARRNAKQVFIDYFSRQFDFEKLSAELNQPREFISFLRYCFGVANS